MELKQALKAKKVSSRKIGLTGLFGHIYVPDEDNPGQMRINSQFEIVRRLPPDRWLVQLFSVIDGCPVQLKAYPESFLLGDEVKLYLHHSQWIYVCDSESRIRRDRRRDQERRELRDNSWIDDFK